MLMNEQITRQRFENDQRDDIERRWEALKKISDDEIATLRDALRVRQENVNKSADCMLI